MGIALGLGLALAFQPASGGGDSWSPTDLGASLLLWLDGQDTTTLLASSGGLPVTSSGDPVGSWADKSGNARHADQGTAAAKPTRDDAALNGHCGLTFDGGDLLVVPTLGALTAFELWVVVSGAAIVGLQVIAETYDGSVTGGVDYVSLYYDGSDMNAVVEDVSGVVSEAAASATAVLVRLVVDTSLASGAVTIDVDGSSTASGANAAVGAPLVANPLNLGNNHALGYGLDGAIGEVVAVDRLLTSGEATSLRAYLNAHWGL